MVTGITQSSWLRTEVGPSIAWLARFNAVVLIAIPVMLAAEATLHYAQVGLYALSFHLPLRYVNAPALNNFADELVLLIGLTLCALFVDAAAINVESMIGGSFSTDGLAGLSSLFSDVYHAFMTFIFSTQLEPSNVWGQTTVILISLQGIGLLVLALAAFTSASPMSRDDNNR
jgi:hypothetical protein